MRNTMECLIEKKQKRILLQQQNLSICFDKCRQIYL